MEGKTDKNDSRCPSLEEIAAFLDGRGTETERLKLVNHASRCEACAGLMAEAGRQLDSDGASVTVSSRSWRRGAAAIAAVGMAAVVALALLLPRRDARQPDRAPLIDALGRERPFEPRLTGGFPYGPLRPVMRGASPESRPYKLLAAAAKLKEAADARESAEATASLGAAELVLGESENAVKTFENASLLEPKNARILTDLAAAYLVHAREKDRPEEIPKAIEAAEKATEIDPTILEAWFDRACALEALALKREAAKAWRDYLKRDSKSGWAGEARRRLAAIEAIPDHSEDWKKTKERMLAAAKSGDERTLRRLMPEYCQETREWLEEELLPGWAESALAEAGPASSDSFALARFLAEAHAATSGDHLLADSLAAAREGRIDDEFLRGVGDFGKSRVLYRARSFDASAELANRAWTELRASGNPLAAEAELSRASFAFRRGDLSEANRLAVEVGSFSEAHDYWSVFARSEWIRGLIEQYQSRPLDSVALLESASEHFGRCREEGNRARIEALLAEVHNDLGGEEEASRHRERELRSGLPYCADAAMAESIAGEAYDLLDAREQRTALHLLEEIAQTPGYASSPETRITVSIAAGVASARLGASEASRGEFDRARVLIPQLSEPNRSRFEAEIEAEEAHVELPARAAWHLSSWPKLAEDWRRLGLVDRESELFTLRGRERQALGDTAGARSDFETAITSFESSRKDPGVWSSNSDRLWQLFESQIAASFAGDSNGAGAMDLLERLKAPSSDRKSWEGSRFRFSSARIDRIPAGTAILYYLVQENSLTGWIATRDGVGSVRKAISRGRIEAEVARFRSSIFEKGAPRSGRPGEALYELLLGPFRASLESRDTLIIVPDGALHAVPFAALRDPATGKSLVEEFSVSVARSGSGYLRSLDSGRALKSASVLMVIGPAGEDSGGKPLSSLAGARQEREFLERTFQSVDVLSGVEATPANVLDSAARHDVVYFSAHALPGGREPGLARLLLSGEPGIANSGSLFARTIAAAKLSRVRLVILAACRTGEGPGVPARGARNLADAFLGAGAAEVVASLWDVEDESTGFLSRFIGHLVSAETTESAFTATQREMSRSIDAGLSAPRAWSVFELIRG